MLPRKELRFEASEERFTCFPRVISIKVVTQILHLEIQAWTNCNYLIPTVKHAIWLVNSRAGSGYILAARGIKMVRGIFTGFSKCHCFTVVIL